MKPSDVMKSETAAWVLGGLALGLGSALAYWQVGWLGIGLIGLIGLVVATRLDLDGGHAVAESGFGSGDVPMYARQLAARESNSSPEQKLAAAAEQDERSRVLYLIRTVFIAATALGFGMFFLHQV